jgi:hypothetical protein
MDYVCETWFLPIQEEYTTTSPKKIPKNLEWVKKWFSHTASMIQQIYKLTKVCNSWQIKLNIYTNSKIQFYMTQMVTKHFKWDFCTCTWNHTFRTLYHTFRALYHTFRALYHMFRALYHTFRALYPIYSVLIGWFWSINMKCIV